MTYDETAKSVKIGGDGSWRGCDSAVIDFYDDGTVKKIMGYKGSVQVLEEQFMEDGRPEYNKEWYDDGELLNWSKYEYSGGVPATVETEKYLDKDGNVTGGHTLTPVYDSQKRLTEEREFDLDENLLGTTRYIYPDATSTDWNVREYYNPGDTDPWEKESIVTTGDTEILTTLSWNGTAYDETFRSETVYDSNDEVRSYTEYYFKSTKPSYMEMTTYNDKDGTKTVTVVGDLGTTIRIEYYEKVQLDEYPLLDLYAGDFFSY